MFFIPFLKIQSLIVDPTCPNDHDFIQLESTLYVDAFTQVLAFLAKGFLRKRF